MAKYITRIGHGKYYSNFKAGDRIRPDSELLEMGMTGETTIIHHHTDTIRVNDFSDIFKFKDGVWRASDYEAGLVVAAPEQTDYLLSFAVDDGFYGAPIKIIHCYHDSGYTISMNGKRHWGTDSVSEDINKRIAHWNRSFDGICLASSFDRAGGYGFYICIGYER